MCLTKIFDKGVCRKIPDKIIGFKIYIKHSDGVYKSEYTHDIYQSGKIYDSSRGKILSDFVDDYYPSGFHVLCEYEDAIEWLKDSSLFRECCVLVGVQAWDIVAIGTNARRIPDLLNKNPTMIARKIKILGEIIP